MAICQDCHPNKVFLVALNSISQNNIASCGLISSHNHNHSRNHNISSFIIHPIIVISYYKIPYHQILISKLKSEIYTSRLQCHLEKIQHHVATLPPQAVEAVQFDHSFHSCDNCNRSCPSSDAESQGWSLTQHPSPVLPSISQSRSISNPTLLTSLKGVEPTQSTKQTSDSYIIGDLVGDLLVISSWWLNFPTHLNYETPRFGLNIPKIFELPPARKVGVDGENCKMSTYSSSSSIWKISTKHL